VLKHVRVLKEAGLVTTVKPEGRHCQEREEQRMKVATAVLCAALLAVITGQAGSRSGSNSTGTRLHTRMG
jgi:hypothetical protein